MKRKWLEFVARPRFLPLYGDDEDFLHAPIDDGKKGLSINKWSETVKNIIAQKKEREFEMKAAESVLVDGVRVVELGMGTLATACSCRALPPPVCISAL